MRWVSGLTERVVGHLSFPFSNYLLNRKNIMANYREFLKSEWYREDVIRDMQLKKVRGLIEFAHARIPYYRNRFRSLALEPHDIRTLEDMRLIPPLSRQEVIDHHREMVDIRCQTSLPFAETTKRGSGEPVPLAVFRRHKLVRNTSSGSTGAPTVFYENGSLSALNWSCEMRVKKWFGIGPGSKEARMARLATAYLPDSWSLAVRRNLWNQLILPGTNLSDAEYAVCVDKIVTFKPRVLWGYTSALTGLADYLLRQGLSGARFSIELLVSWAAPLYAHEEALLKGAFDCPVTNIYGAREVGHVAALCPGGSLHINQENLLVENEPAEDGMTGPGELLVTTLDVSPMPFIRYRMGDIGTVAESDCSCGRKLQIIKDLLGRTGEIFMTKSGRMISPNFWCRVFMSGEHAGSIRRFQVVYTRDKNLRIVIEKGPGYSQATVSYLKGAIAANFSPDTMLELTYVPKIEPKISGKYQMVVDESKT